MKRFISAILSLIIVLSIPMAAYTYDDLDTLKELIAEQNLNMSAASEMANAARKLGYDEDHNVIVIAKAEWQAAFELREEYQFAIDDLNRRWRQKEKEYPEATYIWNYLKNLGYSNQVCAGILGNMMAEVGGQTLLFQPYLSHNGYYGICQWSRTYSNIHGADLLEQCNYLRDTIEKEFKDFGFCYMKGLTYEDFLKMTDIQEVALAFARVYERCEASNYYVRKLNALVAYDYYMN